MITVGHEIVFLISFSNNVLLVSRDADFVCVSCSFQSIGFENYLSERQRWRGGEGEVFVSFVRSGWSWGLLLELTSRGEVKAERGLQLRHPHPGI